uniref:Uncharacterized protein n=1 Tax=Opuntia streptacantha TaxID=393608 RepID=A0A7C8Z692_OPUST
MLGCLTILAIIHSSVVEVVSVPPVSISDEALTNSSSVSFLLLLPSSSGISKFKRVSTYVVITFNFSLPLLLISLRALIKGTNKSCCLFFKRSRSSQRLRRKILVKYGKKFSVSL